MDTTLLFDGLTEEDRELLLRLTDHATHCDDFHGIWPEKRRNQDRRRAVGGGYRVKHNLWRRLFHNKLDRLTTFQMRVLRSILDHAAQCPRTEGPPAWRFTPGEAARIHAWFLERTSGNS